MPVDPQTGGSPAVTLEQTALARLLQERREAAGYSRARLGKIVGISAGTIEGWELGRVARPPFHEIMRISAFLEIPLDALQEVAFADVGTIPQAEHPGPPDRRKPGRKKRAGTVPLLEAAYRLYDWTEDAEAADALATSVDDIRAWRAGSARMDIASHLALTTLVNLALVDAVKAGSAGDQHLTAAAEALGLRADSD